MFGFTKNSANKLPKSKDGASSDAKSRIILLRDHSSSMSWVPQFPKIWNEQIVVLGKLFPSAQVSIYSITAEVKKIEDSVPLSNLAPLESERWHCGMGGVLRGGSALGDGIIRGCQKSKQFRMRGYQGPIGIFLLTDGWSKNDRHPYAMARKWLSYAREELRVTFRILGFVTPNTKERLNRFVEELGILPEEDQTTSYEQLDERLLSATQSVESLGEEVCSTLSREIPQSLLEKQ